MNDKYRKAKLALEAAISGLTGQANDLCSDLRLREMHSLKVMDRLNSSDFNDLVKLAELVTRSDSSFISFLDNDLTWIKSSESGEMYGTNHRRSDVICDLVIKHPESPWVITDAVNDERVCGYKFVKSGNIGSYLGVPIISHTGNALGTVCCINSVPTTFSDSDINGLIMVSRLVTSLLYKR
jgi:GAF domain-containing protein